MYVDIYNHSGLKLALLGGIIVLLLSISCLTLYNLFFHPLRKFPGPLYTRTSVLWYQYQTLKGNAPFAIRKLHDRYGPVVRITPDELVFTNPQAFKDIYGHRVGKPENAKDPSQLLTTDSKHPDIISANREQHTKLRRLMSNAFSDKALREQEPILHFYTDILIEKLGEHHGNGAAPTNIVKWFNYTTFDIIGHLVFAEPFDCLSKTDYHPWVALMFNSAKFFCFIRALNRFKGGAAALFISMIPKAIKKGKEDNERLTTEKLLRRRERKPDYIDFMTPLLEAEEKGTVHIKDLIANAPILVGAGSETTATLLSGLTYLVLTHPPILNKLVSEIRGAFSSYEKITISRVNELKYLQACIEESLRYYPPSAHEHPRRIPPEGAMIDGHFIPGGSIVGISKYAVHRAAENFRQPDSFVPERWTGEDGAWASDKREAIQPFSHGPRNCIGRNLAYIEMRLIIAKLFYQFDLELCDESTNWMDQRIYLTWEKKPLLVTLRSVERGNE